MIFSTMNGIYVRHCRIDSISLLARIVRTRRISKFGDLQHQIPTLIYNESAKHQYHLTVKFTNICSVLICIRNNFKRTHIIVNAFKLVMQCMFFFIVALYRQKVSLLLHGITWIHCVDTALITVGSSCCFEAKTLAKSNVFQRYEGGVRNCLGVISEQRGVTKFIAQVYEKIDRILAWNFTPKKIYIYLVF